MKKSPMKKKSNRLPKEPLYKKSYHGQEAGDAEKISERGEELVTDVIF